MTRAFLAYVAAMLVLLSGCGDPAEPRANKANDKAAAEPREPSSDPTTAEPTPSATPSPTPSPTPTEDPAGKPVDFVRTHLAAWDAGDSETACSQMTPKYRKYVVTDAIESDTVRKGADCDVVINQYAKDQEFEDVDSSDATLKEVSETDAKATVRISYKDEMYSSPYTLFLVKVGDQWLVDREKY